MDENKDDVLSASERSQLTSQGYPLTQMFASVLQTYWPDGFHFSFTISNFPSLF